MRPIRLRRSLETKVGYLKAGDIIITRNESLRGRLASFGDEQACHYLTEAQYEALVDPARQGDGIPGYEDFASEEEPNDVPEDCSECAPVQDGGSG